MQQHDLRPNEGAKRERKRVGRGIAAGQGKTAGKGTKGQKARSGPYITRGFEGGQNPIYMRMPYKRGFKNLFKQPFSVVNISRLDDLFEAGAIITPEVLVARRIVSDKVLRPGAGVLKGWQVKVLGNGELTKPFTVRVHRVTASAREKIIAAGGTVEETAVNADDSADAADHTEMSEMTDSDDTTDAVLTDEE